MNSNYTVLIRKTLDAVTVDNFRPIMLCNFLYIIIFKIIYDLMVMISFWIISHNQFGLVEGRLIEEPIVAASESFNLVDRKCFGGNVAFKIVIKMALDTLCWLFSLSILRALGFLEKFCSSARVLVLVNGSP